MGTLPPAAQGRGDKPALYDYKDLLTASDIAKIFDVSLQTIYKEIRVGKFGTPIKIGRAYKIPKIRIIQRYFS
jgi:predicted DNA-binding transcriptional regulator AlpA